VCIVCVCSVCVCVCVCVCACVCSAARSMEWMCGVCFFCSRSFACNGRFLFSLALQGPLNCPHRNLSPALGYIFDSREHTQSVGDASFALCVCIDDIRKGQHAQHGTHSDLHRCSGRIARTSSQVFAPQECVCAVCFAWFHSWNPIFAPSLHPRRLALPWVHQHKFRIQIVSFI